MNNSFDQAMFEIYLKAKKEAGYNATIFYRMLHDRGGVETAKRLINAPHPSDGYTALCRRKRLDLTVEAMIIENEKWHNIFTSEEIKKARRRLKDFGYEPKN